MTTVFAWIGFGAIVLVVGIVLLAIFVVVGKIPWPFVSRNWATDELAEMAKHLCKHKWTITGGTFVGPLRRRFEMWGFVDQAWVERQIYGFTLLTQRCDHCGKITTTRHVGKIEIPGKRWSGQEAA